MTEQIPGPPDNYLYVIELGDRIKVGRSGTPVRRLAMHRAGAVQYGVSTGRSWISEQPIGTVDNELALIYRCLRAEGSARISREWFTGLRFEDVVGYAERLDPAWEHELRKRPNGVVVVMRERLDQFGWAPMTGEDRALVAEFMGVDPRSLPLMPPDGRPWWLDPEPADS